MAKRTKKTRGRRVARFKHSRRKGSLRQPRRRKSNSNKPRLRKLISDTRLERALRVYSRTKDIGVAARSIGVSKQKLERAAMRRILRRKRKGQLTSALRRLPRRMPIFSGSKQLAVTVNAKSASIIGNYMAAVRQFLRTNDPKHLTEFIGLSVKDVRGKAHHFETDPNTLYRLSSAGHEPFEMIYRIVL